MSMTPAFSPGPWITHGAFVGSVRRWIFEDLYEQCSFHIAEKMPSSVIDGSRPMSTRMRWYSSALSPCAATSDGEIFARLVLRAFGLRAGRVLRTRAGRFVVVLAIAGRGEPHLCRLLEVIGKSSEQAAPIGRTERRFYVVFRVRHHAEHFAVVVEHARNGIGCAVNVPSGIERAIGRGIANQHPALGLKPRDRILIGDKVSLAMGGWHADHLPGIVAAGEWRVGALDPQVDVAANEFERRVAHQHARQ